MPRGAEGSTDPLLTLEEVAERLRVSPTTAWRYTRDGELPAFDVGRKRALLRVRTSAVEAFLKDRQVRRLARRTRGRPAP